MAHFVSHLEAAIDGTVLPFGRLANLGEVTCLLAALVVLPCLAAFWLRPRTH